MDTSTLISSFANVAYNNVAKIVGQVTESATSNIAVQVTKSATLSWIGSASQLASSIGSTVMEHPIAVSSGTATGLALLGGLVIAAKKYPKATLAVAGAVLATGLGVFGGVQSGHISGNTVSNFDLPGLYDNLAHGFNSWKAGAPMCEPCVVPQSSSMFSSIYNMFSSQFSS